MLSWYFEERRQTMVRRNLKMNIIPWRCGRMGVVIYGPDHGRAVGALPAGEDLAGVVQCHSQ